MQVYKVSRPFLIFIFFSLGCITLVSLVLFIGVIMTPDSQIIARWFLLAWLGLWILGWYVFLWKTPLEIRWLNDETLEFRSVMASTKISVKDIISIKMGGLPGRRSLTLRHSRGRIMLLSFPKDEFLDRVKALNPQVEIRVLKFYNPLKKD